MSNLAWASRECARLGIERAQLLEVADLLRESKCSWAWAAETLNVDLHDLRELLAKFLDLRQPLPTDLNPVFLPITTMIERTP